MRFFAQSNYFLSIIIQLHCNMLFAHAQCLDPSSSPVGPDVCQAVAGVVPRGKHVEVERALSLVQSDHVTRILGSDWSLTASGRKVLQNSEVMFTTPLMSS